MNFVFLPSWRRESNVIDSTRHRVAASTLGHLGETNSVSFEHLTRHMARLLQYLYRLAERIICSHIPRRKTGRIRQCSALRKTRPDLKIINHRLYYYRSMTAKRSIAHELVTAHDHLSFSVALMYAFCAFLVTRLCLSYESNDDSAHTVY